MNLKQKILNKLNDSERGFSDQIAKITGYSSGSALRKVLNDPKKEFGKFSGLIKAVQTLFPDEEKELLIEYTETLDPNKQTARYMLEYFSINLMHDCKIKLAEKLINSKNEVSKEWGKIVKIYDMYLRKKIDNLHAINSLMKLAPKSAEGRVLSTIYQAYCYLDQKAYDLAFYSISIIKNELDLINDEYIRQSFKSRYYLTLGEYYTRKHNLKEARKYCNKVLQETDIYIFISLAYLHIGNSFMLESYDLSYSNLKKGYELVKNKNLKLEKELERSLNFLNNFWGKEPFRLDFKSKHPSDQHEIAFYYINKNEHKKAIEILENESKEELTNNELAFHYYLKGLIDKKIHHFARSVKYFTLSGDMYFRKLALIKLKELGVDESVIDALDI